MTRHTERALLQAAVGLASLVPLLAGGFGMVLGVALMDPHPVVSGEVDAHFRYLSGLLFGIGVGYATAIPRIEAQGMRFRLLTPIVFVGGLARLAAYAMGVSHSGGTVFALTMELVITPALALWQWRVAKDMKQKV